MTYPRSENDQRSSGTQPHRRDWIRPAVRRMSAGSAEDGALSTGDSGIKPS